MTDEGVNPMPLHPQQIAVIVFGLAVLLFCLCIFAVFASIFRIWLQAFMAGVHISLPQILGMKFRKVNPNTIVRTAIMVTQAGTPVPSAEALASGRASAWSMRARIWRTIVRGCESNQRLGGFGIFFAIENGDPGSLEPPVQALWVSLSSELD
jgi:hypothetical protein